MAGTGVAGFQGDGGLASTARLNTPCGLASAKDSLYIADRGNNRVRLLTFSTGLLTTFAGSGDVWWGGDGVPARAASLYRPEGVAVDEFGNVLIVDTGNSIVRVVSAVTGVLNTIAGNCADGYTGDNILSTNSLLNTPSSIATDGKGSVWIADTQNDRVRRLTKCAGVCVPSPSPLVPASPTATLSRNLPPAF